MRAWIRKWWKPLLLVLLLAGFLLYPPVVLTEVRIDFEDEGYGAGRHWKALTSFTEHAGLDSVRDTYSKPGEARIFFWDIRFRDGRTLKRMDPIDYNSENEIRVKEMAFFINGFYAGKLEGEELLAAFEPNEQVQVYETDSGTMGLLIQGEDAQLIPTEAFQEFYSGIARQYARTGVLYLIPILAAAVFVVEFYRRRIWRQREGRFFLAVDTLLYAVGVAAILLVLAGAFTGSSDLNPDESESIYSVRYYISHWAVPDARELDPEAYSAFGTARLTELNLFYIFAAQIARLFTFEHGARLFSVMMFAGLMYLLFWNLKKNRFLLCALYLTPQVWYLYTYCTSDALDFAVGVLALYQVANPDSMLHRLTETGINKRNFWKVLLLGFLFSNIFMSKQNYYVLAIYAVFMLMADLFAQRKEQRRQQFTVYLWLSGAALLFLGIRYIPEFLHYGFQRGQVLLEMQEAVAIPKLNPASPPSVQSSAFNLYGKGVALTEVLFGMGLNKTLFRSFVGTYGSLQFPSPDWYCTLMGVIYLMFLLGICWQVIREKGHAERKVKLALLFVCGLISYALVIYNAWFVDFQAQGRYMLPVLIFAAHAAGLKPEAARQKWFQIIICATAVLSLYSFGVYCIPNIQPPY